ncbi:MAG TPA: FxLYD domain-containing protein [Candidatus Nitrosocosmicus sp.]
MITLFGFLFPYFTISQEQGTINTFTNSPIYLNIDKIFVGNSPTGLISVKGVVHNNSTSNIENVKVKVKLLGVNNDLSTETVRFVTPPSFAIKPGDERNFDFLISASNFNSYNITAYGDKIQ